MISGKFILGVALLLSFFFIGFGCSSPGSNDRSGAEIEPGSREGAILEGKEESNVSTKDAFLKESVPPIDRHTPETLETATFALG